MRFRLLVLIGVLSAMAMLSSAALAEVSVPHQICTPGDGDPVIPSPHHKDDRDDNDPDPTKGKILNNPHVDADELEKVGFIPHHHLLHHGPSAGKRNVKVDRHDEDPCEHGKGH